MKKLIVILFACYGILGNSQNYTPFPTDSAMWGVTFMTYSMSFPPYTYDDRYYWIDGDTILFGNTFQKIYKHTEYLGSTDFYGYMREDTSKHIYFSYDGQSEHILYDFNLSLNDTIFIPWSEYLDSIQSRVAQIDSVQYGSSYRKRYTLEEIASGWGLGDHIWVEGIGSISHGVFYPEIWWVDQSAWLMCYSHNGEGLYGGGCPVTLDVQNLTQQGNIVLYPNPTSSTITIQTENIMNVEIINIQGKVIYDGIENAVDLSAEAKGIYIVKVTTDRGVAVEKVLLE